MSPPTSTAKLTPGAVLTTAGGALMLIASFLPWYEVDFILGSGGLTGWQEPGVVWSVLAVMLSTALALLVLQRALHSASLRELPRGPAWGGMVAVWSFLPLICVALKLLNDSDFVAYGFYVAFAAAGLQALGGGMVYRESRGPKAAQGL